MRAWRCQCVSMRPRSGASEKATPTRRRIGYWKRHQFYWLPLISAKKKRRKAHNCDQCGSSRCSNGKKPFHCWKLYFFHIIAAPSPVHRSIYPLTYAKTIQLEMDGCPVCVCAWTRGNESQIDVEGGGGWLMTARWVSWGQNRCRYVPVH